VSEYALTHQADDPANQYFGTDKNRATPTAGLFVLQWLFGIKLSSGFAYLLESLA